MKNLICIYVVFHLALFVYPVNGFSQIIFQDDFESYPSGWKCTDGYLSKWSAGWYWCGTDPTFGAEWKMGPGYNSNNAVYCWKKQGVPNEYRCESMKWVSGTDVKTEIYNKWYMKIPFPSQFDKTTISGNGACKLWRYILREQSYTSIPMIYLQLSHFAPKISQGNMLLLLPDGRHWNLKANSVQMDGKWHCHEIRIKLNSKGISDGIIQYWFDGVLEHSWTGINFGFDAHQPLGFYRFDVGLGNCGDEPWDQTEWSAMGFDGFVVSTEYVGPTQLPPPATTPPAPPRGLRTIQ